MDVIHQFDVSFKKDVSVSCCKFFIFHGTDTVSILLAKQNIDQLFTSFVIGIDDQKAENMEMEASFLLHFLGGLGYWAGAICPAIANRRQNTFDSNYQESIYNTTRIALQALADLREKDTD